MTAYVYVSHTALWTFTESHWSGLRVQRRYDTLPNKLKQVGLHVNSSQGCTTCHFRARFSFEVRGMFLFLLSLRFYDVLRYQGYDMSSSTMKSSSDQNSQDEDMCHATEATCLGHAGRGRPDQYFCGPAATRVVF